MTNNILNQGYADETAILNDCNLKNGIEMTISKHIDFRDT